MRFFNTAVSVALAAFSAVASAQASTKANAITAPLRTDTITAGKQFTIKWSNIVGATVSLDIETGPSTQLMSVYNIVSGVPNTGSYTWNVPSTIPASSDYAIRISYDNNPADFNYSDKFTFVSSATGTLSPSSASMTTAVSSTASVSTSVSTMTETSVSMSTVTGSSSSMTSGTAATTITTSTKSSSSKSSSATSSAASSTATTAPPSAANSNLSSPLAVIMAVLAAALFLH